MRALIAYVNISRACFQMSDSLYAHPQVLSISCVHGFMRADVPAMGAGILVMTNNDAAKAQSYAEELGAELFSFRGRTLPPYLTAAEAITRAMSAAGALHDTPLGADIYFIVWRPLSKSIALLCIAAVSDLVVI